MSITFSKVQTNVCIFEINVIVLYQNKYSVIITIKEDYMPSGKITAKQQEILEYIKETILKRDIRQQSVKSAKPFI